MIITNYSGILQNIGIVCNSLLSPKKPWGDATCSKRNIFYLPSPAPCLFITYSKSEYLSLGFSCRAGLDMY
jgi:hypothetical protein